MPKALLANVSRKHCTAAHVTKDSAKPLARGAVTEDLSGPLSLGGSEGGWLQLPAPPPQNISLSQTLLFC